ncbi:hypothetical protein LEP1GSC041_2615 [Leptospira noguchii str. 2006001870]|nr:hypothetical protein LEP1GSC041_2615 [Leptospira noguchii str. 2006001870]
MFQSTSFTNKGRNALVSLPNKVKVLFQSTSFTNKGRNLIVRRHYRKLIVSIHFLHKQRKKSLLFSVYSNLNLFQSTSFTNKGRNQIKMLQRQFQSVFQSTSFTNKGRN